MTYTSRAQKFLIFYMSCVSKLTVKKKREKNITDLKINLSCIQNTHTSEQYDNQNCCALTKNTEEGFLSVIGHIFLPVCKSLCLRLQHMRLQCYNVIWIVQCTVQLVCNIEDSSVCIFVFSIDLSFEITYNVHMQFSCKSCF